MNISMVCFVMVTLLMVAGLISPMRKIIRRRREYQQLDEADAGLPEGEFRRATVLAKKVEMADVGRSVREPAHQLVFNVTFLTDDGEETYSVDRTLFDQIYEGQSSTLGTVNGSFFSFGEGTAIENNETGGNEDEI